MTISASSWIGINTGDTVHERDNPRHLGRVEAVRWGIEVRVRWYDNGWTSLLRRQDVVVAERVREIKSLSINSRPATVTESPARQLRRWMGEQRN